MFNTISKLKPINIHDKAILSNYLLIWNMNFPRTFKFSHFRTQDTYTDLLYISFSSSSFTRSTKHWRQILFKRPQSIQDRTDVTRLIYRIVRILLFYRQHASFHCLLLMRHFNRSFIMAKTKNQRRKKATRFENNKKLFVFPFMLFYLFYCC